MTNINLDIAKTLDGSTPYMGIIFVDSYGDKLLQELTLDDIYVDNGKIMINNQFLPCAHCGLPVLDCNFDNGSDCCDRCAPDHPSELFTSTKETAMKPVMNMDTRIKTACTEAQEAFWEMIVKHFPEANDGQFLMSDIDDIMLSWVKHWVDCNVPQNAKQSERGYGIDGLNLFYLDTWHIWHSGGGCMHAITDNVAINGQYNYLVVSSDCVAIYEDTFKDEEWMDHHICCWNFGDNPTVLMNMIDDYLGGSCLWDTGKLFDDIMTIAKSDKI